MKNGGKIVITWYFCRSRLQPRDRSFFMGWGGGGVVGFDG